MFSWWRKRTAKDHADWLYYRAQNLYNRIIVMSVAHACRDNLVISAAAALPVAIINEMFVDGEFVKSDWPAVRHRLKRSLAYMLLTVHTARDMHVRSEPEAEVFVREFETVCERLCQSQLALAQLVETFAKLGPEEAVGRLCVGWLEGGLFEKLPDGRATQMAPDFFRHYLRFHLDVSRYLHKHFHPAK